MSRKGNRGKVSQHGRIGRNVAFIGGPDAGKVRIVPEDVPQLQSGDWIYHIHPIQFHGTTKPLWFAYNADVHPAQMIVDLWESYSETESLKRATA
jgi:hypothetical protein